MSELDFDPGIRKLLERNNFQLGKTMHRGRWAAVRSAARGPEFSFAIETDDYGNITGASALNNVPNPNNLPALNLLMDWLREDHEQLEEWRRERSDLPKYRIEVVSEGTAATTHVYLYDAETDQRVGELQGASKVSWSVVAGEAATGDLHVQAGKVDIRIPMPELENLLVDGEDFTGLYHVHNSRIAQTRE